MVKFWTRKDHSGTNPGGAVAGQDDPSRGEAASGAGAATSGLVGYLDAFDEGRFQGWAADLSQPQKSVHVEVRVGGKLLRRVKASVPRSDVNAAGHPGDHGFDFVLDPVDCEKDDKVEILVTGAGSAAAVVTTDELRTAVLDYVRIISDVPRRLAATQDLILFDMQDLVSFLHQHNSVTGIQRVVGGIIQATLAKPASERPRIHFCMMADDFYAVRVFDEDRLLHIVDLAMAGGADQTSLTKSVMAMRRKAPTYRPKEGDCFFIGGAYWIVQDDGPRLNALKSLGVSVATYIYDLIPITAPEWVMDSTRREVAERAIDILLLSDFLLTISDFVRKDVEKLVDAELGITKPVIAAPLPHQLPPRRHVAKSVRPAMKALGDFVLCVCTLEGRKNHILLYRVWSMLLRQKGVDNVPDLVLVGKWGWNIQSFKQACASSDFLNQKIRLFANVGDDELAYLYDHCLFTVFPSFMEGWGLPVGESLAAGKLCVASTAASIPEVGGDFCEYIGPRDFFGAAKVISGLIEDRQALAAKNQNIKSNFVARTWGDYSRDLLATIARHAGEARARKVDALGFEMEAEKIYEINSAYLNLDETVAWHEKASKFVRVSGWGVLEEWGVWSIEPEAKLSLRFAPTTAETATLLLELKAAVEGDAAVTADIAFDGHRVVVELTNRSRWVTIPGVRSDGSTVSLSLSANFEPSEEPDRRQPYIGLSRLLFCESTPDMADGRIPMRLLRVMGLFAGDTAGSEVASKRRPILERSVVDQNFM